MTIETRTHLRITDTRWRSTTVPRQRLGYGFVAVGLFLLAGCGSTFELPPLSTTHPAHPEAMASPMPPVSTTLAYGPADIPSPQPAGYTAQHERQPGRKHGHEAHTAGQEDAQTVVGEGQVIAVVPSGNQIVIDHKAIQGFMDAMTMGYQVERPALLEGVQAGDQIRFTIDPQKKAIVKIEKQ